MSLSPAQVRLVVESGLFDDALRLMVAAVAELAPFLSALRLAQQRDRSRLVTRRKQRRRW